VRPLFRALLSGIAVAIGLVFAGTQAFATEVVLDVDRSQGAASCPGAEGFVSRINAALGRDAAGLTPAETRIALRLDRTSAGFAAHLTLSGGKTGERELSDFGATCDGLAEAVVVAVTLILDEGAPMVPFVPDGPNPRDPLDPPRPVPPSPLPRLALDVYMMQTVGILGPSTLGFGGSVSGRLKPMLTIGGGIAAVLNDVVTTSDAQEVQQNLAATYPEACFTFGVPDRSFQGALCGQVFVGFVSAQRTFGSDGAIEPFVALGNGAIVEGPIIGPLSFTGRVTGVVPLYQTEFLVQTDRGLETAFRGSPIGVALGFGIRAYVP
jgi:hypothetical protein